jgi:hypothetical protein
MQITNQIVMEFFGDDQVIEQMLRPVNPDYINAYEESDDESEDEDYESDNEYESDDETESDDENSENEEEELHQFYRDEVQAMVSDGLFDDLPELVSESDSDTDVLEDVQLPPHPPVLRRERPSDYPTLFERDPLVLPPPALRRETSSDYLSPYRNSEQVTPSAPRANRRVLRDITNIRPRRLAFN